MIGASLRSLLIITCLVILAIALLIIFIRFHPFSVEEIPPCEVTEESKPSWRVLYINVSIPSMGIFSPREGMYTYRLVPSTGNYYEVLTYTVSRINESYFSITKVSTTYLVEGNETSSLEPSYSTYIINTSGYALFIKSWSSKIGEKYFNLELWPTSDNSMTLVVSPLFLPYLRPGNNWSITVRVDIYFPNQLLEYLGHEEFTTTPNTVPCKGPTGTCYVVNSELNVTIRIYEYVNGQKGSFIGTRHSKMRYRYLVDTSGITPLLERYIDDTLISKIELTRWK